MTRPRPTDWHKTIDDLLAEKRGLTGEEIEWARSYERDRLRDWARFPRAGEVYELSEDAELTFLTHWGAPFTGGGKGLLNKGTRIRIADDVDDPEPVAVHATPVEQPRVEAELVPEPDRKADEYGGFSLSIKTAELNRLFRLVSG